VNPTRPDPKPLGFTELKTWLRHRHPMVLIDRVLDHEPGQFLTALVAVSGGLEFVAGHFPERAVYPGTHLIQVFSQAGIILAQMTAGRLDDTEMTVVSGVEARFFHPVVPGDRVEVHVRLDGSSRNVFAFSGPALVDGKRVAAFRATLARTSVENLGSTLW
jgi:3-hydroxyacyl-[acyl-carrier-protein] dehydratase